MPADSGATRAVRDAAGAGKHATLGRAFGWIAQITVVLAGANLSAESLAPAARLPPGAELRFQRLDAGGALTRLVLSADGRRLYAASATGKVGVWDVDSGRLREVLTAGEDSAPVLGLHVNERDDVRALIRSALLRWDGAGRRHSTPLEAAPVSACAFSADRTRLAVCGTEPPIAVLDAASGATVRVLDPTISADELAFSPDGAVLAGARLWRLCLWNVDSGKELAKRRLEGTVRGFAFSPDGRWIFADVDYEGIIVLETSTGAVLRTLSRPGIPDLKDQERRAIAVSPDASLLAETGPGGTIVIWEVFTQRRVLTLGGHDDLVTGLAFHPDGRRLVSAGQDGAALLWDLHHESLLSAEDAGDSLSAARLEQLWQQLGDGHGDAAYGAFVALLHHPEQTLALIESPPGLDGLAERLIRELDDANSSARSAAYERLKSLSIAAEPMLRAQLEQGTSAELASRIRRLLSHLRGRRGERERHEIARRHRLLRSVHLLKWIGTPVARDLLDDLAQNDDATVRDEADSVRRWLDRR